MENQDSVKSRLLHFLKTQRISQTEFCRELGVSSAYVSTMRKGMSLQQQMKVREVYPELNLNWLLYGEGDMLLTGSGNNAQIGQNNYNSSGVLEQAISEIAEQRKLTAESQSQVSRLLSIIENLQKTQK